MDIEIRGCRGSIRDAEAFIAALQAFASERNIACQAFDADAIYGEIHLLSAAKHAVRSFRRGTQTCNDLAMEILLYASGCRQIRDAIQRVGIRRRNLALVAVGRSGIPGADGPVKGLEAFIDAHSLTEDSAVLVGDSAVLHRFGISREERQAIDTSMYEDLILEQVAMVDLLK